MPQKIFENKNAINFYSLLKHTTGFAFKEMETELTHIYTLEKNTLSLCYTTRN